ncbi:PAB1 binding protein [Scheffersomyces coipomensis]|uniref:PAB1 binding protein n=1 Tax=Scheffersomyces coipomensis TaxID=1788519 RepID=UPI00315E01D8
MSSSTSNSNILKRKNEDLESSSPDQINKRVALDSEQLDLNDNKETKLQTAPAINNGIHEEEPLIDGEDHDNNIESAEPKKEGEELQVSKPVSNHTESDPTYVQFRMYCPVKEAGAIVGKKGETINHIREKSNVRINVSDNLKGVPERIVTVRGAAENVARAFGLITRTILEEPEDEVSSPNSQQFNLKILVPHPMIGYIIGKQGVKFREIEENSAAKLKAAEQALPYSTDRVLSITGVADAIHIAIYYISQIVIEHKDCLKKNKILLYNPSNYHHSNVNTTMMNIQGPLPNMMLMGANTNPLTLQTLKEPHPYQQQQQPKPQDPYGQMKQQQQQQQPYNFQMVFQPSIPPQQHYGMQPPPAAAPPMQIPPQNPYTDEHGNTIVGEIITNPPVQVGPNTDKFNQDIFVANSSIGSVIGKRGNNIKHIRETSQCSYVKIEPDKGQSIMLGGGKGFTNIRKLTLTGSIQAIQTAMYLINQRIAADKERNAPH